MKHRTARSLTAITIGAMLALAGCSSDDESSETPSTPGAASLEAVTLTGDAGAEPTLEFETPFAATTPAVRVVTEGTGETLASGNVVSLHSVTYAGSDGTEISSTYPSDDQPDAEPQELLLGDQGVIPALTEALDGQKVGTTLVLSNYNAQSSETYLLAIEVTGTRVVPPRASGEAVVPADGLPAVTLDDSGTPTITIPEGYAAPADLIVQPLIAGTGETLTPEHTVVAHYTGWKVSDGTVFDSSWERGAPIPFPLQGVIAGWTEGLTGQTVGSQVLLVVPKAKGYGATEGHELQNEDLVFVVDILEAM